VTDTKEQKAKSKLYRLSVFGLISGSAASQILIAASIPIIARIFTPNEMGYFFAFDAYCDVLALGSTLALDKSLYTINSRRLYEATIATTLLSIIITAVLAALILLIYFGLGSDSSNITILTVSAFFIVLFRGAYYLFQSIGIRNESFLRIAVAENIRAIVLIAGRIALGVNGLGVLALVFAAVLGSSASVLAIGKNALTVFGNAWAVATWANMRVVLRRFRRNILFEGTGQFLRQIPIRAPVILVVALFSPTDAGFFSIALLLTYRPAEIIIRSVAEVARSRIGASLRLGDNASATTVSRHSLIFNMIAAPILVFTGGLIIYLLEGIVFPETWAGVGLTTLSMSPYVTALMLARPLQSLFSLYAKHASILAVELTLASFCLCGFAICGISNLTMNLACILVGVASMIAMVFFNCVALRVIASHKEL
jgi:O-antigen/teichoic acid export membrane protein